VDEVGKHAEDGDLSGERLVGCFDEAGDEGFG